MSRAWRQRNKSGPPTEIEPMPSDNWSDAEFIKPTRTQGELGSFTRFKYDRPPAYC